MCQTDMVLLLDTSYSIEKTNFDRKIKPFLKTLVFSPKLKVGPKRNPNCYRYIQRQTSYEDSSTFLC